MRNNQPTSRWKIFLVASLLSSSLLQAQSNLIPNGNFESISSYPIFMTQPFVNNVFPSGWTMPTDGTPDVINDNYNTCDNFYTPNPPACFPQVCDWDNKFGRQTMMPATAPYNSVGHVYMGITTAGSSIYFASEFREYLKCNLNVSGGLSAGQCYRLTYWVSLADMSSRATTVQAVITSQNLDNTNNFAGALNASNCALWYRPTTIVTNKQGWVPITFDFIAEGGETYLYLGFFEYETSPNIDQDVYDVPKDVDHTSCMSNTAYTNPNNQTAYYYIDNVSLFATAGPSFTPDYIFSNANPNISGTFSNQEILISGDVTISGNTTFDNCTVKCNDGSTITVGLNKTLQILNNTVIEAGCQNMWDGIIVVGGAIIMRGSRISDAKTAITFDAGTCYWQMYRDALNRLNNFSRNTVDIVVNASWGSGSYINATVFDHVTPLHDANEGIGGYGTYNIVFTGLNSSNTETIGSTTASEGCVFTGGQSAIVSDKYNVNLVNCTFSNQAKAAVDFEGEASIIRTLNVTSCTFMYAQRHIWAHDRVDLTVKSSAFSYATQNAIEWMNNHDCYLRIGDETNSALGNTFTSNGWNAVVAMHNATWQTVPDALRQNIVSLSNPSPAHYTSIVIGKNTVNCIPSSSGFLIAEWQSGQFTSYRELNIIDNDINSSLLGMQLFNVKGWGGVWPVGNEPVGLPPQKVQFNMIYTSTQYASSAAGIKVVNSPGFAIEENGVSSDNSFNYTNHGILCNNSEYSEVYGNIVSAGSCINAELDMFGSALHCNWLSAYSTGFYMGYTWLRASGVTHGSPGIEQYNNLVPYTMYPWNSDIFLDNSDVQFNQWIWNNAATNLTITPNGNTGSGSLISTWTGPDLCENGLPGYAPFNGNPDFSFTNPELQWIADYNHEVRRRITGYGSDAVASANIKALLDIEALIHIGAYADALVDLGSFTPSNNIEANYKAVLNIFATCGDEGGRATSDTEKSTLMAIAELPTRTGGPAVTLARGYLEAIYYLHYSDPRPLENGEIKGSTNLSSPCSTNPTASTQLSFMDEDGTDLQIGGCYVNADGTFIFDPQEIAYLAAANPTTEYRMFSKPGSRYTVVNFEYHTLGDWLAASPLEINLAGVSLETDTITPEPYTSIDAHTVIETENATYEVGWVTLTSTNTDMLITKTDKNGLVWSRTWSAPRLGLDTATCLYVDALENVYVAGKVDNGHDYDVQILKYDTDGNLIWSSMIADEPREDDYPNAITVNAEDGGVEIIGLNDKDDRYIKVWECLPGGERRGQINDDITVGGIVQPAFYPNPNNGNLMIDLKQHSGGTLELINVAGQVVFTEFVSENREIHLPTNVENGVYLLKFTGEGEPYYQKLMIYRNQ